MDSTDSSKQQQGVNEYTPVKRIGTGSFGTAHLVKCKNDDTLYVIKAIILEGKEEEEIREAYVEAKIHQHLSHPNIIAFKEVFVSDSPCKLLHIVMDYAEGGDLGSRIKEQKGKNFSENQILDWFTQICLAIKHLHDKKIIHRDLKSQNIFLTANGIIKLGDFGIAKKLDLTTDNAQTVVGTPYYLSPEIVQSKPYNTKSDIWSLGVLLYEMCTLKMPFDANSIAMLSIKIMRGKFTPLPNSFSRELKNLINMMLQVDCNKRPSIIEILRQPVIKGRIKNFLTELDYSNEFSQTIIKKLIPGKSNLVNKSQEKKESVKDIKEVKEVKDPKDIHHIHKINSGGSGGKESAQSLNAELNLPSHVVVTSSIQKKQSEKTKGVSPSPNKARNPNNAKDYVKKEDFPSLSKEPAKMNFLEKKVLENERKIAENQNKISHNENSLLKDLVRNTKKQIMNYSPKRTHENETVVKPLQGDLVPDSINTFSSVSPLNMGFIDSQIINNQGNKILKDTLDIHRIQVELESVIDDNEIIDEKAYDYFEYQKPKTKEELNFKELAKGTEKKILFDKDQTIVDDFKNKKQETVKVERTEEEINSDFCQLEEVRMELETELGFKLFKQVYDIVKNSLRNDSIITCDTFYMRERLGEIVELFQNDYKPEEVEKAINKFPQIFWLNIQEKYLGL